MVLARMTLKFIFANLLGSQFHLGPFHENFKQGTNKEKEKERGRERKSDRNVREIWRERECA